MRRRTRGLSCPSWYPWLPHADCCSIRVFRFEATENEWGTFEQMPPATAEALRRISTVTRFFSAAGTRHLISPAWEPHVEGCVHEGVFASIWPGPGTTAVAPTEAVWLVVNRANTSYTGRQIGLPLAAASISGLASGALELYDCWHGVPIVPTSAAPGAAVGAEPSSYSVDADGNTSVSFNLDSRGYGCVLLTANGTGTGTLLGQFLGTMQTESAKGELSTLDPVFRWLQYSMVKSPRVRSNTTPATTEGMVLIPAAAPYFEYSCGADEDQSADMQYYWELAPHKVHAATRLPVESFYIDETPVTAGQYSEYLAATGYWPTDTTNFLKNWGGEKACPADLVDRSVTYVSQDEARLYCAWANKRLPHEWEWQLAAQGPHNDNRAYPWGAEPCQNGTNTGDKQRCTPPTVIANNIPKPAVVGQHSPQGDSPFGVKDLLGTVWQYTSEVQWLFFGAAQCAGTLPPSPHIHCGSALPDRTVRLISHRPVHLLIGPGFPCCFCSLFGAAANPGGLQVQDPHTRSNMLRGGSNYMAGIDGVVGSHWYFPMVSTTNNHNHYRLMSDSYERAGTLGFRCVADVAAGAAGGNSLPSSRWSGPPPAFTMLATADATEAPGVMPGTQFVDATITASTVPQATAPVIEWARFGSAGALQTAPGSPRGDMTMHTARSAAPPGGYAVGSPRCHGPFNDSSVRTGGAAFSWSGGARPGALTANATVTAVGCAGKEGFQLSVRVAGKGPQTLALYGGVQGWPAGLTVTAVMSGDGAGAVTQVVTPGGGAVADTVHHITFEGQPGVTLNVTWALNTNFSAPSTPPPLYTYTEYQGVNCYRGHGAVEIDVTPVANLTAAECKARCTADDTCSCAQYSANGTPSAAPGSCWKRAQCIPDSCAKSSDGGRQSVFVKDYFDHAHLNCFDKAGATCLPEPCSTHTVVNDREACVEHCEADADCAAALFSVDRSWCWKRADVVVASCQPGAETLMVKPTKSRGGGASAALLYAATLSDGVMPPLYGY